jgi:hypothetical protein
MTVYYRVLSVDDKEHTFVVRYWTDKLSEIDLKVDPRDHEDPPIKCRTDYNITAWEHDMTPDELHEQIVQSAPKQWFAVKEKAVDGVTKSMHHARELVNINKEAHLTQRPYNDGNK